MKMRRLLLAIFALAGSAAAQFTVVTGTVTDPNGLAYANGTIVPTLVTSASPTLNGLPYSPPSGATGLDGNGKFTMRLGDNSVLLPASTKWQFLICSAAGTIQPAGGKGPVCFTVPALTISGSSQSITSNISAVPPPALSNVVSSGGTVTSVACTAPVVCAPSPITASGTISGPTIAIGPGLSVANDLAKFASTDGVTLADAGPYITPQNSTTISGAINAQGYGVKADGHIVTGPSFTNTSNIVTCTNCNFTGTDAQGRPNAVVGQIVFGTNATSDVSALTSVTVTPECLIQSIDSATQIHMGTIGSIGTACNATGSTTSSGFIVWGDLDSATSTQTPSTANDALLNAWTAASNNCLTLTLPSGVMLVERAEFATVTGSPCSVASRTTFLRAGYSIQGQGAAGTILVPTPNFVSADCTVACFFGASSNMQIQDLQLTGVGNSGCGSGFSGKNLIQITGDSTNNGTNFTLRHVIFQGWCANQSGVHGLVLGSGTNTISGGLISDSIIETLGNDGTTTNYGTSNSQPLIQITNDQFTACGNGGCLTMSGGRWNSVNSFYGYSNSTTSNVINLVATGLAVFTNDYMGYQTGTGTAEISCVNCTLKLVNTYVNNPVAASFGISQSGTGTQSFTFIGSTITASTAADSFTCFSGNTCNYYDLGGNTIGGFTSGGTFNQWQTSSVTGTACATGNFALTSGWGTSSVASASGDSHRCHMTITGAAGGAGPVLTWTYPTAYLAAPFSCQLTGAGTDTSLSTVRTTSLSRTAAAFTFTGTPTAVTYTFDISCGP